MKKTNFSNTNDFLRKKTSFFRGSFPIFKKPGYFKTLLVPNMKTISTSSSFEKFIICV